MNGDRVMDRSVSIGTLLNVDCDGDGTCKQALIRVKCLDLVIQSDFTIKMNFYGIDSLIVTEQILVTTVIS